LTCTGTLAGARLWRGGIAAPGIIAVTFQVIKCDRTEDSCRDRAPNANNIGNMNLRDSARLGEVEQLVLLAVWRLDGEAYAVPIRELIAKEAGIDLSRGSIYITLDRLEEKGLVESWFGDPIREPGGKARRLFRIRPSGTAALRSARRALDRLATGTPIARKT